MLLKSQVPSTKTGKKKKKKEKGDDEILEEEFTKNNKFWKNWEKIKEEKEQKKKEYREFWEKKSKQRTAPGRSRGRRARAPNAFSSWSQTDK